MTVQPFSINVPQETLDDLQSRLARTRWPDEVEGAGWDYGTNPGYMKELAAYWQTGYDWRAQEAALNQFAHFRTEIDGFGLHFIHQRGKGPNPQPLLLLHGWPDSFYRFYKLIPMLTDPAKFGGDPNHSFDVIVPSLPGFGFSERPHMRGVVDVGIMLKLMTEVLGYSRFSVHGGDTGASFAKDMALRDPKAVASIHLTDIGWDIQPPDPAEQSPAEKAYLENLEANWSEEDGYIKIQGTKPQTLAYGLNDSPVGLAAWIVEKFRTWSDSDGDVERSFSKDELLTNIMIYWVTETINSSIRWYYEGFHAEWEEKGHVEVPVGVATFPKDQPPPRELGERYLNVQRWTEMPRGGHFAALEEPELLANDMRAFFGSLG